MECDASRGGIIVVLMQDRQPYSSKGLNGKTLILSTYEEMFSILLAMNKWR